MIARTARRVTATLNNPRRLPWVLVGAWVAFSAAFSVIEHKGPIQGLWWGIVTGSTVGYGDYSPTTTAGRGIGALFIVTMALLLIFVNGQVTARAVEDNSPAAFTHEEQLTSRRVDDETNHLVRTMFVRAHGPEALAEALAAFEAIQAQVPATGAGVRTEVHHPHTPALTKPDGVGRSADRQAGAHGDDSDVDTSS